MASSSSHSNRPSLESLNATHLRENQTLLAESALGIDPEDLLQEPVSTLFEDLQRRNQLLIATGHVEGEILSLYHLLNPFIVTVRQPGSRPKSSWLDMLVCYLAWFKTGADYTVLACVLGDITASRVEDNINRIRPLLRSALSQKWLQFPVRPVPLSGTIFPYVALLIDNHTTQCNRPRAPFNEAKIYYDGKNRIYGLKTEIAVTASAPHYCVFVGAHTPGSVHDFEILKRGYNRYLEYLLKLPTENAALPTDQQSRFWAVIADKGYIGPEHATPDLRRLTPIKDPQTPVQITYNQSIGRVRVPVECFFGRIVTSFGVFRNIYRWSHSHFDADFEIACCLVNEQLEATTLNENDSLHYRGLLIRRVREATEKEAKRKLMQDQYRERKRRRLSGER